MDNRTILVQSGIAPKRGQVKEKRGGKIQEDEGPFDWGGPWAISKWKEGCVISSGSKGKKAVSQNVNWSGEKSAERQWNLVGEK